MKRLKNILLQMENNTSTYREMYEGPLSVWDPNLPPIMDSNPSMEQEPTYYYNDDFGFAISGTHKLAQDKPTIVCMIPTKMLGIDTYVPAAADYCLRQLIPYIDALNAQLYNRSRPDNENGKYYLYHPGGEVLLRNTAYFAICPCKDYEYATGIRVVLYGDESLRKSSEMHLCIRLQVQLPKGKLRKSIQMLCRDLPDAIERFTLEFNRAGLTHALELSEKQAAIRDYLRGSEYCAFIANGSILPRAKGTDLPLLDAIPFQSTPGDEIEICGVKGMGIKRGVTVITGGGYSGKSTLLDAISAGIYDHTQGDGRELCITDDSAMTISAEDGRSVKHVNIAPFIKWLPGGDTRDFSTDHASGSTSQTANIMEAVDYGSRLLLIDEDKSATNFMIRDKMMKDLIAKEPITPFTDRVGELYHREGVSTILVIGGSGEYLSVADRIYMMEDYLVHDVTERSKKLCKEYGVACKPVACDVVTFNPPTGSVVTSDAVPCNGVTDDAMTCSVVTCNTHETPPTADWHQNRTLSSEGFTSYPEGSGSERLEVYHLGFIRIGDEEIDIRGLHDIISKAQLDALGFMLRYLEISNNDTTVNLAEKLDALYHRIEEEGLDCIFSSYFTSCVRFLDLPRKYELLAVINRMRMTTIT